MGGAHVLYMTKHLGLDIGAERSALLKAEVYICLLSPWRKYLLSFLLCLWWAPGSAQLIARPNSGFNIGLVSAIGNRFQRLGFTLQGYYCYNQLQANAEVRLYRNFRNLGPRRRYSELVASAGLLLGYGSKSVYNNPFLSSVSNQTGYKNSIGYSYNAWFNRVKTGQQTGTISLQYGGISLISENDLFARPELDRFRTAAILVQYQYRDKYQFTVNCTMWTGQMGNRVVDTRDGCFPYGYMDTTGGVYTQYSHGLLSAQGKASLGRGQYAQANLGIDAEQVRNFLQNKMIHDMVFLPRKWHNPRNCHMPMLDSAGNQYLHLPGQQVKRPQPYWNLFTSPAIFY